jgi:hypothetical protein
MRLLVAARWRNARAGPSTPLLKYSIIARLIGLLLFAAAALKFTALGIQPVRSSGILTSGPSQLALIVLEITLGVWLLSGRWPITSWLVAMIAFSGFAIVTFRQGWIGQASCGCFGKVSVSPWYTFALDLVMLVLLALGRPDLRPLRECTRADGRRILRTAVTGAAGVGLFLVLFAGAASWRYGSTDAALAHLRSERVSVRPGSVDLGEFVTGDVRQVEIEVVNRTDNEVRVIGGSKD